MLALLLALGAAVSRAQSTPLASEPPPEPPPEAGEGDYTLEAGDSLTDQEVEVAVGAASRGADFRRSQRVSFRGGGTRGTLREGDDALRGGRARAALGPRARAGRSGLTMGVRRGGSRRRRSLPGPLGSRRGVRDLACFAPRRELRTAKDRRRARARGRRLARHDRRRALRAGECGIRARARRARAGVRRARAMACRGRARRGGRRDTPGPARARRSGHVPLAGRARPRRAGALARGIGHARARARHRARVRGAVVVARGADRGARGA